MNAFLHIFNASSLTPPYPPTFTPVPTISFRIDFFRMFVRFRFCFQAIESLRGLLGEYGASAAAAAGAVERTGTRSPPATATTAATAAATAAVPEQAAAAATADGELARVAHGRLEWLTRRLRAHLSSELASALRQVDPLAAAGSGDAQGAGGGGRGREEVLGVDEKRRREGLARVKVQIILRIHTFWRGHT